MDANLEGFIGFLEKHGLVEFDVDGVGETYHTNRVKLQKYVFLAKYFGMPFRYKYDIYLYGPFSDALAVDYYALARSGRQAGKIPAAVPDEFRKDDFLKAVRNDSDWLEIAATIVDVNADTDRRAALMECVCRIKNGFDERYIAGVLGDLEKDGLVSVRA